MRSCKNPPWRRLRSPKLVKLGWSHPSTLFTVQTILRQKSSLHVMEWGDICDIISQIGPDQINVVLSVNWCAVVWLIMV